MSEQAAASGLTLDVEREGDQAVVRCHGKLVAGVTTVLYAQVKWLIPDHKRIVLDLSDLAYMDSMGIGVLVRLYVSAKTQGCELVLTHLGKRIRQMLGTTGLLSVFTIVGEHGVLMKF